MQKDSAPICVALDGVSLQDAEEIAAKLKGLVWGFKLGDLIIQEGASVIKKFKNFGGVFADLKLYDIPNTVKNSVGRLEAAGADLITVHLSGGPRMLEAAQSSSGKAGILGVTALTSFEDKELEAIYQRDSLSLVKLLADVALKAQIRGIVCSPLELHELRDLKLEKVVPGIRPTFDSNNSQGNKDKEPSKHEDQRRVASPEQALSAGANLLVIGRPITQANDPLKAVKGIIGEITPGESF